MIIKEKIPSYAKGSNSNGSSFIFINASVFATVHITA